MNRSCPFQVTAMADIGSRSQTRHRSSSSNKKSAALATLKTYEAICAASVLEDCADQLAILGAIMPGSYESRKDAKQVQSLKLINAINVM